MEEQAPQVSVVIPIYNEEGILRSAVNDLRVRLPRLKRSFELILAENGSTDDTVALAQELSIRYPEVSTFSVNEPNYGLALRQGIERARGTYVVCEEVDICDMDFHAKALEILETGAADLVVGSKAMPGALDRRPVIRKTATFVINQMLRITLGFTGTDTHGLKAFRREALLAVARACVVDRDLFASEFVIRAGREDIEVREIPVSIAEKRPPSIDLARRVPAVMKGLGRLFVAIRLGR